MPGLKTSSRLLMALLALGGLSACSNMGGYGTQDSVAMADGNSAGILAPSGAGLNADNPYMTGGSPVASTRPVRGLDDSH